MRKGVKETKLPSTVFNVQALDNLQTLGFKYVQVKGLTIDKHFDYVSPQFLVLVPYKELPTDPLKKDIYEPIKSDLLYKWASEINEFPEIIISGHNIN